LKILFQAEPVDSKRGDADLVVFPLSRDSSGVKVPVLVPELQDEVERAVGKGDFSGKLGETMLIYLRDKREERLLLLGLGEGERCDAETLRRAYGSMMKRCRNKKWASLNVIMPQIKSLSPEVESRAIVEGIELASYVFERWKQEEKQKLFHVKLITLVGANTACPLQKYQSIMSGVHFARDLINGNAKDVTPQMLGMEAKKLAAEFPQVKTTVLGRKQLEKEGMRLLLAVASGSAVEPVLIQVEYQGDPKSQDRTLLVGKGITFDSGGLNLKPTKFIEDQRCDMSGGAAALGVIRSAIEAKLRANIVAIVPAAENAVGPESFKPGDVYFSHSGKSVEVANTDAEGRLILADALSYGQEHCAPSRIIDFATLTGAVVIALGKERIGMYANDDAFARRCETAGEVTGERVWRMPLDEDYEEYLTSEIADIKSANTDRSAGSVTAAVFLHQFIEGKTPWIHLDIAGTAFLDKAQHYHLTSATASGVRLVFEIIEKLHKS